MSGIVVYHQWWLKVSGQNTSVLGDIRTVENSGQGEIRTWRDQDKESSGHCCKIIHFSKHTCHVSLSHFPDISLVLKSQLS